MVVVFAAATKSECDVDERAFAEMRTLIHQLRGGLIFPSFEPVTTPVTSRTWERRKVNVAYQAIAQDALACLD